METSTVIQLGVFAAILYLVVMTLLARLAESVPVAVVMVVVTGVLAWISHRETIVREVAAASPAASYGITNYLTCKRPGAFQSNPEAYCRQMITDLATKQHGEEFAKRAVEAISQLELRLSGEGA